MSYEERVKLLKDLCKIQSSSGNEKRMKSFIKDYVTNTLHIKIRNDGHGNLYCDKGRKKNRAFVVSHMDTVHAINNNVEVFEHDGIIYAMDTKTMSQYGTGGDDKVGIWAALISLSEMPNVSAAFFISEEIGCVGSNKTPLDNFSRANWMAQLDRREREDFIVSNFASASFIEAMTPLVTAHGMSVKTQTSITDVNALAVRGVGISAVNIASGYYRPHTSTEVINISDAMNAVDLLLEMISNYGDIKFPHIMPKPEPIKTYTSKSYRQSSRYNDRESVWDEELAVFYITDGKKCIVEIRDRYYGIVETLTFDEFLSITEEHGKYVLPTEFQDKRGRCKAVFNRGKSTSNNTDASIDELSNKATHIDKSYLDSFNKEIMDDEEYWADVMRREKDRELEENASSWKKRDNYRDYESEAYEDKYDKMRTELDSALFMFAHTWIEFFNGDVPNEIIKNISKYLYDTYGRTISDYASTLKFSPFLYEDSDYKGSYTNFGIVDNLNGVPY